MPGIDIKDNVFKVPQKAYSLGDYDRLVNNTLATGIQQVIGMTGNKSEPVSLIFAKKLFKTVESVKSWIDKNKDFQYKESNEMTMSACYDEFASEEFIEYYDIPVESFNEVNPNGWLFICREFDLDGRGKVTEKDLIEMKENIENNVRGIKLDIDYDHKKRSDKAAGWYGEMKLEKITIHNGREVWALFTKPEWTKEALKTLEEKEYRYFSPEIAFKYYDNEKKKWYKNVLFGGGLTNRPEIKGQPMIGEVADEGARKLNEEDKMKLSELMKVIGVSFSEDEEANVKAIGSKFEEQEKTIKKQKEDITEMTESVKKLGEEKEGAEKAKKDREVKVLKLEEEEKERVQKDADDRVKALCEKAIKEEKVAPVDANFAEKSGHFYKLALSNIETAEKFLNSMEKIITKPEGSKTTDGETTSDKRYNEIKKLADSKMKENKELTFDEAFNEASTEITEDKGGNE